MSELLPCPFCGSTRAPEVSDVGECEECANFNGCLHRQENHTCEGCDEWERPMFVVCNYNISGCGVSGPYRKTEAEAIAAWNSRAERVTDDEWESYQNSVPATEENMAKFGWVRERTCRNLDKHHNIMFKCSECGHWECQDFDGEKILPQTWNYCPNCGCKVVG